HLAVQLGALLGQLLQVRKPLLVAHHMSPAARRFRRSSRMMSPASPDSSACSQLSAVTPARCRAISMSSLFEKLHRSQYAGWADHALSWRAFFSLLYAMSYLLAWLFSARTASSSQTGPEPRFA